MPSRWCSGLYRCHQGFKKKFGFKIRAKIFWKNLFKGGKNIFQEHFEVYGEDGYSSQEYASSHIEMWSELYKNTLKHQGKVMLQSNALTGIIT